MKKTLALVLSLIIAFSCFTLCAVSPVSAETVTSANLLADYTVYNWTFAADRPIAERTTENPETHKGGYCFGARSVGYRGFYTTFAVEANKEYTLTFSVKSMYTYEYARLAPTSECSYNSGDNKLADASRGVNVIDLATLNANNYTENGVFKDNGQWTEVSYTFTPTESTDYNLSFAFGDLAGSTSTDTTINPYYFAISDLSLTTEEEVPDTPVLEANNLLADYTVYNWTFADDRIIAERTTENPETYKGGYCFGARSVGYRGFHTTFPVTAGKTYVLSFAVKSMYTYEYARFGVASDFTFVSSSGKLEDASRGVNVIDLETLNANNYTAAGVFKDDGQWTEVSYEFTPTESVDYALAFSFGALAGSTSTDTTINPYYFAISDLSLTTDEEPTDDSINLFADITVADWVSSTTDNRVLNNAAATTVSRYGGYAFMTTSVHYQAMRLPFSVEANTDYVLSFSVKSSAAWEGLGVFDAANVTFDAQGKNYNISDKFDTEALASLTANTYSTTVDGVENLAGVDAAEWTDITIKFTPTADSSAYVLYMAWADSLGYNDVIISDLKLSAKAAVPTSVVGNGAVKADPTTAASGESVTYTATAYQDDEFLGWYDGDTLVSTEATYEGKAFEEEPLTAKFTGANLLADMSASDWESNSDNITVTDGTASARYGGKASVKLAGSWRGTHYTMNLVEGKEYTLSFSYYIPTHASGMERIATYVGTNVTYASDGQQSNGVWVATKELASPLDAWGEYSYTFTASAATVDWAIGTGWNAGVIISDISLTTDAEVAVTANALGNGAVKADPASVLYGEGTILTANAYQNDRFIGWYDSNDTLVSIEKTYTVDAVYGALDITAKFTGNNILADMTADDWYDNTSSGYEGVDIVVDDATADSLNGGTAIKFTSGSAYRGTHIDLPALSAGTYKLQLNVYHPADSTLSHISVVGNATYSVPATHSDPSGQQANVLGGWQNLCSGVATTEAGWATYSKVITIQDGIDYDVYIDCEGGCNGTIFSDFSFVKYAEEADSLYTAHNNMLAIRGADSTQGVASGTRIYNQISKTWIESNNIVEFGVLAIRTERLGGGDLTLNAPGVASSVSWTATGDESSYKLWDETDTAYEFTAVLINIAPKYFDDSYTMTTYAKDANGNIYYGDNQELSMYQSIYSVLSAEPENEVALELAEYGTQRGDTTYEDWKTAWES